MLPRDVLAGGEADDVPRAVVGPRTVSGYPVSHRSPLASSYAAVITVRGLRTPSTGWNLPTAVQTAPTSTGAVRVHVGSVRPGRSARVDSGIAAGWGHGAALLCVNQSRLPRPWGRTDLPMTARSGVSDRRDRHVLSSRRAWLVDVHPCCWSRSNPSRRRSSANSNSNWSSQPEPTTDLSSWVAAIAIS